MRAPARREARGERREADESAGNEMGFSRLSPLSFRLSCPYRRHRYDPHAILAPDIDLLRRILILARLAAAQRQRDRRDDRNQQYHGCNLKCVDIFGIDQAPELLGIAVTRR